jgi:CheY-like chemotaxis protein
MPGRSGAEVFAQLRNDDELANIPVCIVTGAVEFRAVLYHRNVAPPDGYVQKPVEPERLMVTVRRLLEVTRRSETPMEVSAATPS